MTLQMQWDLWLVGSFKKHPSARIQICMNQFAAKMGVSIDEVEKLQRTPKEGQGRYCRVTRFVCGYIPNASEIMFNDELNPVQKALKLSLQDSTAEPVDIYKCKSETDEKQKARKALKNANDEYAYGQKARELQARRAWHLCK